MSTKLPLPLRTDQNPIRPSVDPSVTGSVEGLNSFLNRQAETLHREQARSAGGDTTLSWEILTQTEALPRYTLGSEGRFWHEDYGIIRARYVKFDKLVGGGDEGFPVGILGNQENPWVVTDDLSQSHANLVVGVAAPYDFFESDSYGWVITDGVVIQSIGLDDDVGLGDSVTWTATGKVGAAPSSSKVIGASLAAGSGDLPAAKLMVSLSMTSVPLILSNPDYDPAALMEQLAAIQSQITNLQFGLEVSQRQFTNVDKSQINLALQQTLGLAANFANLAAVAASNTTSTLATINANLSTIINYRNEMAIWRGEVQTSAQQISISRNSASASAAEAYQYSSISASISQGLLNLNPQFNLWGNDVLPIGWTTVTGNLAVSQVAGKTSAFAVEFFGPTAATAATLLATPTDNVGLATLQYGSYVMELDVELVTSTLTGLSFDAILRDSGGTTLQTMSVVPSTDLDVTGTAPGAGLAGLIYRYRKLVKFTNTSGRQIQLVLGVPGAGVAAKDVKFYRAGIRAASKAEVDGGQALIDAATASASVVTETSARVAGDAAIASTVTTLSTTVAGHTSTLTTYGTSISGLQAEYGVEITAGSPPKITGFKILGSATRSDFIISATKFQIDDGSATPPFTIVGGVTYIKQAQIQASDIVTSKIAADAVSRTVAAFTSGTISIPNGAGTWTNGQTLTITTRGGPIRIDINFHANWAHASTITGAQYRLVRQVSGGGAATVILGPVYLNAGLAGAGVAYQGNNSFIIVDSPPAGTYDYYYQLDNVGCTYFDVYYRALSAMELLK